MPTDKPDTADDDSTAPASAPVRGSRCLTFSLRLATLQAGRDPFIWPDGDDTATATSTTSGTAPAPDPASGER